MGVWDDLKKRIAVRYTSDGKHRKPKPKDLDRYEKESGFKLPDDYREFVLTFGPGTFGRGWEFSSPGFPKVDSDVDLAYMNRRFQEQNTPLHQDHVRFCGKEDFHGWWAWNPKDVTNPERHEYGIYLLLDDPPVKVASTFREFVMSYALGGGFQEFEGQEPEPGELSLPGPISFSQVIG
jgi:hypothetical protein